MVSFCALTANAINSITAKPVDVFFKKGSVFTSEPYLLLSEEVKNDDIYINLLNFLANGVNKPAELSSKLGIAHQNLSKYLSLLEFIGIVVKEFPVGVNPNRKSKTGVYRILDNFIDFYFKELKKLSSFSTSGEAALKVYKDIDFIASHKFEDFSIEFILLLSKNGMLPFTVSKIGRWWGSNSEKSAGASEEEIDVVALNEESNNILFAECKWTNAPAGVEVYNNLKRKARFVQWSDESRKESYALFSKSGFTDKMKELAGKERVMLFDLEKIEKIIKEHCAFTRGENP